MNYNIITADIACTNAQQVLDWLTSLGLQDKRVHLNRCANPQPNNQFLSRNDCLYGDARIRNGGVTSFNWEARYDLVVNAGDEFLVYDSLTDLATYGLVTLSELTQFQFGENVANCGRAKEYIDIYINGVGTIINQAPRTSQYDGLSITFNGASVSATRYGANAPIWGSTTYDFKTYPADIWLLTDGSELQLIDFSDKFYDTNGLQL